MSPAPGVEAIGTASSAARYSLGRSGLADRLDDLAIALTNLVQDPTSEVSKSQALSSLDAVSTLLATDPFMAAVLPDLAADRTALEQAATPAEIQAALDGLGDTLDTVGMTLNNEAKHDFTLSLVTNSQVAQPQVPVDFQIVLQNIGSETTTYDLSVSGLPAGVDASFNQSSIMLDPGEVTPGGGVPDIFLTLTSTSTTELAPFSFTVHATAQEAPEISHYDDRGTDGAERVRPGRRGHARPGVHRSRRYGGRFRADIERGES